MTGVVDTLQGADWQKDSQCAGGGALQGSASHNPAHKGNGEVRRTPWGNERAARLRQRLPTPAAAATQSMPQRPCNVADAQQLGCGKSHPRVPVVILATWLLMGPCWALPGTQSPETHVGTSG